MTLSISFVRIHLIMLIFPELVFPASFQIVFHRCHMVAGIFPWKLALPHFKKHPTLKIFFPITIPAG
jgi:hypothetical protein